ncbi:phospholipase D-like domain-containing protein [Thermaurantiacus sp.]
MNPAGLPFLLTAGLAGLLVLALGMILALRWRYRLPQPDPSRAVLVAPSAPPEASPLALSMAAERKANPGRSGVMLLSDPLQAFAARVALIRAAVHAVDLQYYVWRPDQAGFILLDELRRAADRGVMVRLLLDDNGIAGLDPALAGLSRHPGVSIRLFNPFMLRKPRLLNYAFDFFRLNRRMHNKALVADRCMALSGGRNIGDEYFGATNGSVFADLDILLAGPAAEDLAVDFDRYWTSPLAFPAARILGNVRPLTPDDLARGPASAWPPAYAQAFLNFPMTGATPALAMRWVPVTMISDDPAKALGAEPVESGFGRRLLALFGEPRRELVLVSPYFVPMAPGTEALASLARSGVGVKVLTNSLDATNHRIVHTGYARRRRALLKAGIRLFEMKGPDAWSLPRRHFRIFRSAGPEGRFLVGSQSTALHAKTFAVDRERLFVGTFNFDPRSVNLNTELGFIIDCPDLAAELHDAFDARLLERAYEVRLDDAGSSLIWLEWTKSGIITHRTEPGTSRSERLFVALLSPLPIEWLL